MKVESLFYSLFWNTKILVKNCSTFFLLQRMDPFVCREILYWVWSIINIKNCMLVVIIKCAFYLHFRLELLLTLPLLLLLGLFYCACSAWICFLYGLPLKFMCIVLCNEVDNKFTIPAHSLSFSPGIGRKKKKNSKKRERKKHGASYGGNPLWENNVLFAPFSLSLSPFLSALSCIHVYEHLLRKSLTVSQK